MELIDGQNINKFSLSETHLTVRGKLCMIYFKISGFKNAHCSDIWRRILKSNAVLNPKKELY